MSDRETVPGTVVVGVDGSEGSLHALDWAIDAAAGRGATLRLVYAMGLPLVTVPLGGPIRTAPSPEVSQAAKALLEEALRRVQEAAPSLRAVTEVSRAEAHHALLKSAQDAELLVVGSRGYSGVASLFLGSVAQRVASHATCPVVVVPPTSQEAAARRGRVVVGVDGSEHAAAALRFALVEAERLRAELVAVYAWQAPDAPVDPFTVLQADVAVDREQQVARAREWLLRTVDEARTPLTQRVPVRVETPEKHPAAALLDEGADADLIVVGSRGRGGFTGLLLGSVSQQVLNHAVVPVAVVRVSSAG
ncbi:universal stress protein [Thermobifida fusca]|jgi:nucleotide-binding universal stress UspA family protein|uniref:UspA domain-containing protein n=2 Tax=Thermobifida fusca TaxID=2021 RepID=A0A9P2TA74_THEFU|nr:MULTISPECIES: universal stress protein [Thermobifida]AAZ55450.1 conserved hypothetical protein [Thermobifida fusca YX]EOR71484.1 hypothetical protein TM51_07431 [Thermobifida fusca TM51]MBO2530883.1 universal stress protein [Thermobifida sp.]PPS91929.1 universal stress protein UspA [Thermobifida fusca]PZN63150.1 MAG: universal stress protein [Thermobifida fusca]